MVLKFIRWSRGYVNFSLFGKAPERFINICSINGINLWDTKPSSFGLKGSISIFDYKNIRRIAKKSRSKLKITSRHGFPFFIKKYKNRVGLSIGVVLFLTLTMVLSSFIWSINIIGTSELSNQQVLKILEKNGLTIGSYKGSMNIQKIQRDTIIDIPEIGWMSINVQDSCANVEIKEKAKVPDMKEDFSPCNVKAKCDGVITGFEVTQGSVEILRGSAVSKDQLLVNSVVEDKMGGVQFVHAQAKVFADVEQTKTFSMPMENYIFFPTDKSIKRYSFDFFNFNIPMTFADSSYENSLKQYNSNRVHSDRNILPLGVTSETEIEFAYQKINLSKEEVRLSLIKEMALYEVFCKNESCVISRGFTGGVSNGNYTLNVNYVINEDIAYEQEMYITQ